MEKKIAVVLLSIASIFFLAVPAFAHVIVRPHQVGVAAAQDFTVSVPNERDNPVISVRLLIPNGVSSVVPNAVPGWTIDTKSSGSTDSATVTAIDWTGGSIPVGQREEFVFQAQVPAKPTTLAWKAYQTYSNEIVVSWDVDPLSLKNFSDAQQDDLANKQNKGKYSTTTVINDLTGSNTPASQPMTLNRKYQVFMWLGVIGFVLSLVSLGMQVMKKM